MDRDEVMGIQGNRFDVIVIGGGITGAAVFRKMSVLGLRCLLVEQRDFCWGTSSRSGKLVHGGLRYLKQGQFGTTFHSIRAREKMLTQFQGLVLPVPFLIPTWQKEPLMPFLLKAGLMTYDAIAGRYSHRHLSGEKVGEFAPWLQSGETSGGFLYQDARTDDARLVLRMIHDGIRNGGVAINYAAVTHLLRNRAGQIVGVGLADGFSPHTPEVFAQVVVNATGVWADGFREQLGHAPRLRKLRGSHLVLPNWRFPTSIAITVTHPRDHRPLYIVPWEDGTLVGTTDIDHDQSLTQEPHISQAEGLYLMEALVHHFPELDLSMSDVLSTFAGVRPVLNTGKNNPSKESREHIVWVDDGLVTLTGGKLTTFHLLVEEAVQIARKRIPHLYRTRMNPSGKSRNEMQCRAEGYGERGRKLKRLIARYGQECAGFLENTVQEELENIPGTNTLWAELRWAARNESVMHLEDLLLRRTRLGLVTPGGGFSLIKRIRQIVQNDLGWDDMRWETEVFAYTTLWNQSYNPKALLKQQSH